MGLLLICIQFYGFIKSVCNLTDFTWRSFADYTNPRREILQDDILLRVPVTSDVVRSQFDSWGMSQDKAEKLDSERYGTHFMPAKTTPTSLRSSYLVGLHPLQRDYARERNANPPLFTYLLWNGIINPVNGWRGRYGKGTNSITFRAWYSGVWSSRHGPG